jgi:hypothetical protein
MPQEFGNLTCRTMDVDLSFGALGPDETLVSQILAEIAAESRDPVVALRDGHCWAQHFEPVPLPVGDVTKRLRDGGVYLITGGLGTIGLLLAGTSPEPCGPACMTSRRDGPCLPGPLRSTLPGGNGLKEDRGHPEIELGSRSWCYAPMSLWKRTCAVMSAIDGSLGALNGVIHAAGLPGANRSSA